MEKNAKTAMSSIQRIPYISPAYILWNSVYLYDHIDWFSLLLYPALLETKCAILSIMIEHTNKKCPLVSHKQSVMLSAVHTH